MTRAKISRRIARKTSSRPRPSRARARATPATSAPVTGQASSVEPDVAEGIALYNHRHFFECHETLERVWLRTSGRSKDFYKGLIQAAVAFYHWSRGNRPGALTLARSAANYLARYRPVFLGLDVAQFHAQFSELFRWLRRHHVRYDPRLVPLIRPAVASLPAAAHPQPAGRSRPRRTKR